MGKEKKLYELAAANLEASAEAAHTLTREDRKNQHVLQMIKRQEKQRLRKEERKKQQLTSGGTAVYHKEPRSRDRSTAGLSSQNVPHRPSVGITTNRTGVHQGFHHHHQSGKHHRQVVSGKFSANSKDAPPIEVHFSDNVQQEKNNRYFFRRKKSFEERQRAEYQLLAQQYSYKQNQERLNQAANAVQVQRQASEGYNHPISLQNHVHHQNQVVGHLQNFQQFQQQQQQYAVQMQNYTSHQLRPMQHQNSGLPVAAVNALVAQRNIQAPNGMKFRTAGTGGMYDPISDDPSGAPSSASSASKLSGQQHLQLRNQNSKLNFEGHQPDSRMFIPNNQHQQFKPTMRMMPQSVGLLPPNAFAVDPDSSEVDMSSDSYQRASQGIQTQNAHIMNVGQPQIPPHLLYNPHFGQYAVAKPPTMSEQSLRVDDETEEQAMHKMLEKTREAQRQLQQKKNNGSSSATPAQESQS